MSTPQSTVDSLISQATEMRSKTDHRIAARPADRIWCPTRKRKS